MASFQSIVLNYLEHYEPDKFYELRQGRQLRGHMEVLVARLYNEMDRLTLELKDQHPEYSKEQLAMQAERLAIAEVLPLSSDRGW